MTPESRQRLAILVERRLAGMQTESETAELSRELETSAEARELYLRAVEFHLDLGAATGKQEVRTARAPRMSLQAIVSIAAGLLVALAGFWYLNLRGSPTDAVKFRSTRDEELSSAGKKGGSVPPLPKSVSLPPDLPPPPPPPPPAVTNPGTEMGSVPADLILDINGRFDALPPGYRGLLTERDRTKFDELMKSRKGTPDDIDWLRTRLLGEAIPGFQRDAEMIRAKLLELEPKLKENVGTDVVYFRDGRKIEGQVSQESTESVKIRTRFGSVTVAKTEIVKIEKGKGVAMEFPAKYAEASSSAAAEKLDKLSALLAWCAEKNLTIQKEYVAFVILSLDPSNERGRAAAGLARPAPPK